MITADFQRTLAEQRSKLVKKKASELGFDYCGIAKADFLSDEAPLLEQWLKQEMHGKMHYLAHHFDKRLDPRLLVEGAKSVVTFMLNYYPEEKIENGYKIAKYAYGKDYHFVIKDKLNLLLQQLQEEIGEINGRVFVDSAPIMERAWAAKSGLGWQGKHTLLINKKAGSFFFLAEMITDLELMPDSPIGDYCGTCRRCIEACPTEAIVGNNLLDASRCISYLTIELKEEIPTEFQGKMENWIFGCDICQDVCPWNKRFSKPHHTPDFLPNEMLKNMQQKDWKEITQEVFSKMFQKSAVKRAKYEGFIRNIRFVEK
jgi:epoxyqueuosine reductase